MSDAPANSGNPAAGKRGWTTPAAIAIALFLLALVVFPGVMAGIYSRATKSEQISLLWPIRSRVETLDYFFLPASRLSGMQPVYRFYEWQYTAVGGIPATLQLTGANTYNGDMTLTSGNVLAPQPTPCPAPKP